MSLAKWKERVWDWDFPQRWSLLKLECKDQQSAVWAWSFSGDVLSHLHAENVCCVHSQGGFSQRILHSLHIQCVQDTLSSLPLVVHVCFLPDTNAVSSLSAVIKESSWFQQKNPSLGLISRWYSLIAITICWMQIFLFFFFLRCILFIATWKVWLLRWMHCRHLLLLIFPNTSFKVPSTNEIHILWYSALSSKSLVGLTISFSYSGFGGNGDIHLWRLLEVISGWNKTE